MANKVQNRIGLVNGIGVSIHHIGSRPRFHAVAFIFDERAWLTGGVQCRRTLRVGSGVNSMLKCIRPELARFS
jgi:hypothetical protein